MHFGAKVFKTCKVLSIVGALALVAQASAAGIADLSTKDAASGLKKALIKGAAETGSGSRLLQQVFGAIGK